MANNNERTEKKEQSSRSNGTSKSGRKLLKLNFLARRNLDRLKDKKELEGLKLDVKKQEIELKAEEAKYREEHPSFSTRIYRSGSEIAKKGFNGTKTAIGEYRKREWTNEFDGKLLDENGIKRLETLTERTHRESLSDFARNVRNSFSLDAPEPSIREQKYEAHNQALIETHLALSEVSTTELADLATSLQGKKGGINEREANEVLVVWLSHRTRAEDAEQMTDELVNQQVRLMGSLANEYIENADEYDPNIEQQRWYARRSLSQASFTEQELQEHVNRYVRAAKLQDSKLGAIGAEFKAADERMKRSMRVTLAKISPWGDPDKIMEEMQDLGYPPREAIKQEKANMIGLLDSAYDEISGAADQKRYDELTTLSADITAANDAASVSSVIEHSSQIHTIESARLQELAERYGNVDQILSHYDGEETIPAHLVDVIDEMRTINTNLSSIDQLMRYYNDVNIRNIGEREAYKPTDFDDLVNDFVRQYGRDGYRARHLQHIFAQEKDYKAAHNNNLATRIQRLRGEIDSDEGSHLDAERTSALFGDIQNEIRAQNRAFRTQAVPKSMKKIEMYRDKIQQNSERIARYQEETDKLQANDGLLDYYENLLKQITEDDDIIQKMEDAQFMRREAEFMRDELHRNRVIAELDKDNKLDRNEKLALHGTFDQIGESFDAIDFDPDNPDPDEIRKWLNQSLGMLGGMGLGSPEDLTDDELMGFAQQAKKDQLTFMQMFILLFQSLFTTSGERN